MREKHKKGTTLSNLSASEKPFMYDVVSEQLEQHQVPSEDSRTFLQSVRKGALNDFRILFLIDAVHRVTKTDYLLSFD